MKATIRNFLKMESAGGIVLMAAAALALVAANTGAAGLYGYFIETPVEVRVGPLQIAKPLFLWINDGLMAIFFFLVGLELKREVLEGELSRPSNVLLPALGGLFSGAARGQVIEKFWMSRLLASGAEIT